MIVLMVLAVAWAGARLIGRLGVPALNGWRLALPYGLAAMLVFTATAHFTPMRADLERMVPAWVPYPEAIVLLTGVLEVMGAVGLMLPRMRRTAAIALIAFLIAVFPANVKAAREQLTINGRLATPLPQRVTMQVLFIGLLLAVALSNNPGSGGEPGGRTASAANRSEHSLLSSD